MAGECSFLVLAPPICQISGAPLFSGLFHSHTLLTDRPPKGDTRDPTTQLAPDQVAKRHQRGTRQTFGEGRRIAGHNRTTNTRNPPSLRQYRHGPHLSAWKKWINGTLPPGPADDAKTRRSFKKGEPRRGEDAKTSEPGLETAPDKDRQGTISPDLKLNSVEAKAVSWYDGTVT